MREEIMFLNNMPYKTNEEIEKEINFDFSHPLVELHVLSFILSLRQSDRKAVRLETLEEVEKMVTYERSFDVSGKDMFSRGAARAGENIIARITKLKEIGKIH